jgi:hypothetical protein
MSKLIKVIKWLFICVASIILLWFATSYVIYRIPATNERKIFNSEVHYKFIEFHLSNRQFFEELIKNKVVRLEGDPLLFVPASDHAKIWSERPDDMRKGGYTLKAKLTAKPLLFGGYGVAEVVDVEYLEKEPIISK